jgi:hypothetical protein
MSEVDNRSSDEHVCVSVIDFADGSSEGMVLHRGDTESCARMSALIPAVTYNGEKSPMRARTVIIPASEWEAMCQSN